MPRLSKKIAFAAGLAATVVAGGAGGGVHRYTSHAKSACALPAYDYQHMRYSSPVLALSQTAVLIFRPDTTGASPLGRRLKYFELATNVLANGHCSITRFSLILREDGAWWISLRADQNPRPQDVIPAAPAIATKSPLPPTTKQTLQIKRNEFVVTVHGYADYGLKTDAPLLQVGRPLLFDLNPRPFWVQNGQPQEFRSDGVIPDFAGRFDAIDRVELEFTYR